MKICKSMSFCALCIFLAGCIGGIDTGGGGGGGDVGSPTLVVVPGNAETFAVWVPDPTNPGDSYELNRGDDQVFDGTATNFNDTGLTNGQRVCYTVTAVTADNRATSAQSCATPMADVTLTINPQTLSLLLTWPGVTGAASYNIYSIASSPSLSVPKDAGKANGDGGTLIANVTGTSYNWTGLSNCETYPVKVVPVDFDDKESESDVSYIDGEPITLGEIDTSFGTNGIVLEGIVGQFLDVKLLSDGRIAAIYNQALDSRLFIYNSDGSANDEIDLSGNPNIDLSRARALAIDADDNMFIAGRDDDLRVCKLNSEGVLDATFGQPANPGCYYYGEINSRANDVTIDSSGRIILTGYREAADLFLSIWRLTSAGLADNSFATNGVYTYAPGGIDSIGEALVVQGSSIVVAGYDSTAVDQLMVLSVDLDGNLLGLDTDVGAGNSTQGLGIAVAPDGSVVITGITFSGAAERFVPIWNYATDSTQLDFNTYTLTPGAGNGSLGWDIEYDCRDRIVTVGSNLDADSNIVTMRTDDTFVLDTSYGNFDPTNGWFDYDGGNNDIGVDITQDELGRIYAVGAQSDGVNFYPILMRIQ